MLFESLCEDVVKQGLPYSLRKRRLQKDINLMFTQIDALFFHFAMVGENLNEEFLGSHWEDTV